MTVQSHFVVTYDHETKEFQIDYDTGYALFDDGSVYDFRKNAFFRPEKGSKIDKVDIEVGFQLQYKLNEINETKTEEK